MSLRRTIVELDPTSITVTKFCQAHGISTWFFWDLRRRHAVHGDAVLEPLSRAPRTVANKTPVDVEDAIVAKRKELADAGLDAGPATIRFHLRDLAGCPSESTIWRILRQRGFVVDAPSKAPKRTGRSFTAERANDCWQLDATHWRLADGSDVEILNVIDDHSRLLVASTAMPTCTGERSFAALAEAAGVLGWPARFLSDNATAFRHRLADALRPLGITPGHSRPYHPQTCGKVERFHQTLKRWLDKQPPAGTLEELQFLLDVFRFLYNHQRPHRSLDRRFPADVWADAPKNGPAPTAIGEPTWVATRQVTNGICRTGGRYDVSLGAIHNGKHATVIITGTTGHAFIDGVVVREFTIDPTRRLQRLYPGRGRPPQRPLP